MPTWVYRYTFIARKTNRTKVHSFFLFHQIKMSNTDSELVLDEKLDKQQYRKWTSIRIIRSEKKGAHKSEELTKKQKKKIRLLKLRNREYVEDVFVVPVKTDIIVEDKSFHKELVKCVPSYIPPPKISWWDWLTRSKIQYKHETSNQIYEDICNKIIKPIQ